MRLLKSFNNLHRSFRIPLLTWGTVYFLFWAYRCIFSVIGEVVVMRLTPISDTRSYQAADLLTAVGSVTNAGIAKTGTLGLQALATALTKTVGGVLGTLFFYDPIMINIGFQSIAFIGLLAMLRALEPGQRKIFLPILMLPSLTVWSSIASKEALLVFMTGVLCAHIINIYNNKDKIRWYHFIILIALYAYKPHYLITVLFILSITYTSKYFRQKATIAMLGLIFSFFVLFLVRKEFGEFAVWIDFALTSMGGGSVRPRLLLNEYDVFIKAPYGMYLSFFGPTLGEISKIVHVFTFVESSIIGGVFIVIILRRLPSIPMYNAILSFGTVFWIIFLNYPLGATNPGTAIRYRTGYILLVILAIVFLLERTQFMTWKRGLRLRLAPLRDVRRSKGRLKS